MNEDDITFESTTLDDLGNQVLFVTNDDERGTRANGSRIWDTTQLIGSDVAAHSAHRLRVYDNGLRARCEGAALHQPS